MKKNKHSLKISRSYFGDTTLDGYPIATYSNDDLQHLLFGLGINHKMEV